MEEVYRLQATGKTMAVSKVEGVWTASVYRSKFQPQHCNAWEAPVHGWIGEYCLSKDEVVWLESILDKHILPLL